MPHSLNPRDRAEIVADLAAQGIDATPEDVAASFDLFQTMVPYSMDGEPARPAFGPDWTYVPEPGEEALFSEGIAGQASTVNPADEPAVFPSR